MDTILRCVLLALSLSIGACATTSLPPCPPPVVAPQVQVDPIPLELFSEPLPSQTYVEQWQTKVSQWRQQLTTGRPSSTPSAPTATP